MHLLVIVLNKTDRLDDILEAFLDIGIEGATIFDSMGMGRLLSDEVPLFAGLREMINGGRAYSKTIFAVISDETKLIRAINRISEMMDGFCQPDTGLLFTLPVGLVLGGVFDRGTDSGGGAPVRDAGL